MACERHSVEKVVRNEKSEKIEHDNTAVSQGALANLQEESTRLRQQMQNRNKEERALEKFGDNFLWMLNEHLDVRDGKVQVKDGRMEWKGDMGVLTENGQVTKIEYPNGTTRDFGYVNGKMTQMTDEEGSVWKSDDEVHWHKENGKDKIAAGIKVDANSGLMLFDGTQGVQKAGDALVRNVDGHVTDVMYPNGKNRAFEYQNGKLCGYTGEDGAKWNTTDGLHWKRPDTGSQITGIMNVDDRSGEFSFLNLDPVKKGEKAHMTTVSSDGKVRTDVDGQKFEGALAQMVNGVYDSMPKILFSQNVGRDQVLSVMLDNTREADDRVSAAILLEYLKRDLNRTECGKDDIAAAVKNVNFKQMLEIMNAMTHAA